MSAHSQAECPDWYPSLRAAKYSGNPWPACIGAPWSDLAELCCHIAEAAEAQAHEHFAQQAAKQARRER